MATPMEKSVTGHSLIPHHSVLIPQKRSIADTPPLQPARPRPNQPTNAVQSNPKLVGYGGI